MASKVEAFITRWAVTGSEERANKDTFLIELCDALGVPRPDPKRDDDSLNSYVFEKDVVVFNQNGRRSTRKVDLYRHGSFLLEAKQGGNKGAKKHSSARRESDAWHIAMADAFGQALGYAMCLDEPPPFLIVCDIGHCFDLYADFDRSRRYNPFPSAQRKRIFFKDLAQHLDLLRAVFEDPYRLDPSRRAARITREVAAKLAELALRLETAGHDQRVIARFLMRCLFTMFAEDVGLLPDHAFTHALKNYWLPNPPSFAGGIQQLWQKMNEGGEMFGIVGRILRFNGGLFADSSALPLDEAALKLLHEAALCDWSEVEPSIFGTLLERALDPHERHRLGAHYTPRSYVERLVRPTIEEPLRAEWDAVRAHVRSLVIEADKAKGARATKLRNDAVKEVKAFHRSLCSLRVLDPACGTGNFLYVAMDLFRRIENEILTLLDSLGVHSGLLGLEGVRVTPAQFLGIEIKPWAKEIAEVVLWIGFLQGQIQSLPPRKKGDAVPVPEPVLQDYKNIECRDAILAHDTPELVRDEAGKPVSRWDGETYKKDPSTGASVPDESARVPLYRYPNPRKAEWPRADFIVGNPPFLGKLHLLSSLGEDYVRQLRKVYGGSVPDGADLVMYWWKNASTIVSNGGSRRFGFITTNSVVQSINRKVVEDAVAAGLSIVYAIPDHPWVDAKGGAHVRISMTVGSSAGENICRVDRIVSEEPTGQGEFLIEVNTTIGKVNSDLSIGANVTSARPLNSNSLISSNGICPGSRGFFLNRSEMLRLVGGEKSYLSIVFDIANGIDVNKIPRNMMFFDTFGLTEEELESSYPIVFQHLTSHVLPERRHNRDPKVRRNWWLPRRSNENIRNAMKSLERYIVTTETSQHRVFSFLPKTTKPEHKLVVVASTEAWILGILSSRIHVTWAMRAGSRLEDRPVYVKRACFDPFPFPDPPEALRQRIGELGEKLDAFRKERQKAHPELTITEMYNVLEKLRRGEKLEKKEPEVHQKGLVTVLRKIHDDLDAAVFEAYGWPGTLSDEEILERLVALNAERAEEERQGKVRWLRPEYQNPKGEKPASQEKLGEEEEEGEEGEEEAGPKKPAWPGKTRERIVAVRDLLLGQGEGWTVEQVARSFKGANQEAIAEVLESLEALGLVVSYEDQQARCWRRAGAPAGEGPSSRRVSVRPSSAPAARPEADEVTQAIAWLEGVREKEAVFSALVEMNHRLDHWFREGREALCVQLLERVAPEKIEEGLLVGLLMNSVRGGEPLVEPRRQFRERIRPVLVEKVGEERTRKILGRSA